MTSRKGLSTLLTAVLAVVAHVVFLLAPATCSCASERPAAKASAPAHACCCKPGSAPMSCHEKSPAKKAPSKSCASSHASCQAEPPKALVSSDAQGSVAVAAIAPVTADLALPPVPAPVTLVRERDEGPSRAAPIGLVIARTSILLI